MQLTTTKNQIDDVLREYPEARKAVNKLFPELKKESELLDLNPDNLTSLGRVTIFCPMELSRREIPDPFIEIRAEGNFKHKVFFLSRQLKWSLEVDDKNELCLVPRRRL